MRPAYNLTLARVFTQGLARTINGTEPMRLDSRCREVPVVYEPEVWRALLETLRPGDTVVDVGANIGLYSIACARRVRPGKVIAFEPDPENAELLKRTVELNEVADVVVIRQLALGREEGTLPFQSAKQQSRFDVNGLQTVCMSTLDHEISDRVDILKIDVEGFESEVIAGALAMLTDKKRRPRAIFLETHQAVLAERGLDESSILDQLERAGYHISELSRDTSLTRNLVAVTAADLA